MLINRNIFLASLLIAAYFALLFVNAYLLNLGSPVFDALRELITLPMLVLEVVLLIVVLIRYFGKKTPHDSYLRGALLVLLGSTFLTIGSLL